MALGYLKVLIECHLFIDKDYRNKSDMTQIWIVSQFFFTFILKSIEEPTSNVEFAHILDSISNRNLTISSNTLHVSLLTI